MRVGILGGGQWGQALARLALAAGNEPLVAYEGEPPPHILPSTDTPHEVTEACDLVLVAVSARNLRDVIRTAKPHPGNRVVVAGRGIEPESGIWLTDVVREVSDAIRVGALGGPAPVDEILNGGLCAGVVASEFDEVSRLTVKALHSTRYRVYASRDLTGLQVVGAAVPVLATLMGVAQGLQGSGVGVQSVVLSRGLAEIGRLAKAVGAEQSTLFGLAGVGDLVAVQARAGAPYFDAGQRIATRDEVEEGPWGIVTALLAIADTHGVELPLVSSLVTIRDGGDPVEAIQSLMSRRSSTEDHR